MAAETLAATAALDAQAGLKFRLAEVGIFPKSVLLTDCKSLFDHVYSMTGKTAELLLPDVHELREAAFRFMRFSSATVLLHVGAHCHDARLRGLRHSS